MAKKILTADAKVQDLLFMAHAFHPTTRLMWPDHNSVPLNVFSIGGKKVLEVISGEDRCVRSLIYRDGKDFVVAVDVLQEKKSKAALKALAEGDVPFLDTSALTCSVVKHFIYYMDALDYVYDTVVGMDEAVLSRLRSLKPDAADLYRRILSRDSISVLALCIDSRAECINSIQHTMKMLNFLLEAHLIVEESPTSETVLVAAGTNYQMKFLEESKKRDE